MTNPEPLSKKWNRFPDKSVIAMCKVKHDLKSAVEWLLNEIDETLPTTLFGTSKVSKKVADTTRLHNKLIKTLINEAFEDVTK